MRTTTLRTVLGLGSVLILAALASTSCKSPPPELEPAPTKEQPAAANEHAPGTLTSAAAGKTGADPLNGKFTLADATKDLPGKGPIVAKIDTSKGVLQCKLFDDKAPITVANFIGLATGKRPWKDPNSGQWVNKPAYDGTGFHRIIKGFMIQGGDPKGDGSGEPGYTIKDENWEGAKHDRAGLLCMANRGPDTNGAQFFITDAPAAHLDPRPHPGEGHVDTAYTIFGECAPVEVVHDIANVPTGRQDRPQTPVTIKSITISRDAKK